MGVINTTKVGTENQHCPFREQRQAELAGGSERDLSSKGRYCSIVLFLPESRKKRRFNTCILYNPLQKLSPLLEVAFSEHV